ncbi:hypothetical protein [Stenotrophomonas sp. JAG2]|uniref:Y-family DNA polymerase n=1 Tax=Stenotrophomonas sp. JAG2 TaxID=3229243 RepID=UPI0034E1DF69
MRSANFGLYGDMSARVVSILREAAPRVEVYSIDENFIDLTGVRRHEAFAQELRARRWTARPNCIGIGPTKTLAKLANKAAKTGTGVVDLGNRAARDVLLASSQWRTCGVSAGAWRRSWWQWASAPPRTYVVRQRTTSSPSSR